jgi:hypothetical protein
MSDDLNTAVADVQNLRHALAMMGADPLRVQNHRELRPGEGIGVDELTDLVPGGSLTANELVARAGRAGPGANRRDLMRRLEELELEVRAFPSSRDKREAARRIGEKLKPLVILLGEFSQLAPALAGFH